MHILIILIGIGIILYVILQASKNNSLPIDPSVDTGGTAPTFYNPLCFISQGKLFFRNKNGTVEQIHSEHVQNIMDKLEQRKERHGWKEDTSWGTSFTGQGKKPLNADKLEIRFTSAVFKSDTKLIYFLSDSNFGGLFEYDIETRKELRLLHRQNLVYKDLHYCPHTKTILASSHYDNGVANIIVMDEDGSKVRELTGGDTIDTAPSRVAGQTDKIIFQSQGIARSQEGYIVAVGPSRIELLSMSTGDLTTIKDTANTDFLQPRTDKDGDLYFIQRPYEAVKYGTGQAFTDIVLFPFRLLRALFHYLNFFSLMYSRKPLTSASGPQMNADLKHIIVKGKRIDAERALKKETNVRGIPSLVPSTWQLVSRSRSGEEKVLARNVAAFVISEGDNIVYSNGYGVFLLTRENNPSCLCRENVIEEVITQLPAYSPSKQ